MTKFSNLPLADRVAMGVGGGLILLGVVVTGIIELIAGNLSPVYQATVDGETVTALSQSGLPEGATLTSSPVIPPNIRAAIVVAGLVVFLAYTVYVIAARHGTELDEGSTYSTAD